jgi:hypothetical protein
MMILSGIVTIYAYGGGGGVGGGDRRIGRDLSGRSQKVFVSVGAGKSRPRVNKLPLPGTAPWVERLGIPGQDRCRSFHVYELPNFVEVF